MFVQNVETLCDNLDEYHVSKSHIHTYIHTYVHTYIHTYVRTYIHAYIHAYIYTHMHRYTHTHTHGSWVSVTIHLKSRWWVFLVA